MSPATETNDVAMMSIPDAAKRLGLRTTKPEELIAAGKIPSVKIVARRLMSVTGLDAFSAPQTSTASQDLFRIIARPSRGRCQASPVAEGPRGLVTCGYGS